MNGGEYLGSRYQKRERAPIERCLHAQCFIYPLYVHESGGMPSCHRPMPTA